ncbi:ThiF family adenylyltransferase [Corynebacterium atrinae]|uniref:ThiF family adenylyltransferase n=1 Tax=Corynebacterium atrinae TaxID=1336740 RepID=UPI0025B5056A|nr:ThiF family adenylyltransferase [Corynebacterium atrinae]
MTQPDPRYRRQISLIGEHAQEKIRSSHVAVVGAGGLGSPALLYLAGAGVGHVTIIDDDVVELSNLHRQVIHDTAGVGKRKTESAQDAMLALNPDLHITLVSDRLTRDKSVDLLRGADVVLDGTDNFNTRHVVSAACATLGVPHVWASILGLDAQLSVFHAGHGPIYEDLFPTPPAPGVVPSCAEAGVLGPVVGVVGSAMASEALKLVTGLGTPLIGTLGYFSSLDGRWEYLPVAGSPATVDKLLREGPPSQGVREVSTIPDGAVLIDVREPPEFATSHRPGARNVPLQVILDGEWLPPEGETVVMYCASGQRSATAVAALAARGIVGPASLVGGDGGI